MIISKNVKVSIIAGLVIFLTGGYVGYRIGHGKPNTGNIAPLQPIGSPTTTYTNPDKPNLSCGKEITIVGDVDPKKEEIIIRASDECKISERRFKLPFFDRWYKHTIQAGIEFNQIFYQDKFIAIPSASLSYTYSFTKHTGIGFGGGYGSIMGNKILNERLFFQLKF